jgi:hypothetical protein
LGLHAVASLIEGRRKHGHRTFARNNGENRTANAALGRKPDTPGPTLLILRWFVNFGEAQVKACQLLQIFLEPSSRFPESKH